ncbi:hypothetical protein KNO15_08650 [Leifsonia shinshuensis]|uniref:hypothetical protein n=1 Tax=Leifsonia shinshuensis TaxID=150026 RepID=UPI001F50D1A9|nr:hypothetical protein [Leifsonia shinshuensis]MCI0156763.1 hypothetical protein [Leifsonia shinshuensis]
MRFRNYVEQESPRQWRAKVAGIAVLSIVVGATAVPIAASAKNTYYADMLASSRDQIRQTKSPLNIRGAQGSAATNIFQFHLTNTAGAGWLLAGASSEKGGGLGFLHTPYSPGYSNCWWANAQAKTTGQIGLTCYAIS